MVGQIRSGGDTSLRHVVAVTDDPAPDEHAYRDLLDPPGTAADAALPSTRAAVDPRDDLILVYTSGTTGFPEGARHAHGTLSDVAAMADVMGVGPQDRILTVLPFFHVGGSFMSTMTALVTGASMALVDSFTRASALELLARERCTVVNGVPSHFVMMLAAIEDGSASADLTNARIGFVAGALFRRSWCAASAATSAWTS